MFIGDEGVLVSAFYGGSPSLPDHTLPKPGQPMQGLPGGWLLPEAKFKDFRQPEPFLPRCERSDHYAEWIRMCKAGQKSILPLELGCDLTEFALLGTAALRRYSTPGARSATGYGHNGRSDSADVWSTTGGAHPGVWAPGGADAPRYWRTSKVLLWDAKAMRFTNDEVANHYVDTPYRKEWDYQV
jgi:hypothetical protein